LNGAAYLQDHVTMSPQWKALLAIRFDSQRAEYDDMRSAAGRITKPSAWSPTAGLVFTPDARWSLYSNFSTSFAPANPEAEDANGQNNFEPESGRQVEGGARWTSGHVETSVAVFAIVRENVLRMAGGGVTTQSAEEQSRGVEWDMRATAAGFEAIVGYAYTDAEVTKDAVAINVGSRVPNVPYHGANFWGRYEIGSGAFRGLGGGLGVIYRGERAGSAPSASGAVLSLPGYVRTDVGLSYRVGRYQALLRATNVANRKYYDSALSAISIQPGAPRQFVLSLRAQF
jgi:iron complex outermembrane receptor protein